MVVNPIECFQRRTDLPFYDGILKNPDYHKRAKGLKANIIEMSPKEYLRKCESMGATRADVDEKLVGSYIQLVQNGEMMPMPVLDYSRMEQEGRHRALVAERLELKQMPVLVVEKMSDAEWKDFMKTHHPERYNRMV